MELKSLILSNIKAWTQPRIFKYHFPKLYDEITKNTGKTFSEKLWIHINGLPFKCPVCGKPTSYINFTKGYTQYCSKHCANLANAKRGDENPACRPEVQDKIKKTCMERYGVENVFASKNIQNQIRNTYMQRYGVRNPRQIHISEYGVTNIVENKWICKCPHPECNQCSEKKFITDWLTHQNRETLGREQCTKLVPIMHSKNSGTTSELIIRKILDSIGIKYICNDRRFGLEMDIYIPHLNLAIEINGSYWHSIQYKSASYHINKSLLLEEHGIKCIFIWEDYKEEDMERFLRAVIEGGDLNEWKQKWFPELNSNQWPADFGLIDGDWMEHKCMHGGFECYDSGIMTYNQ